VHPTKPIIKVPAVFSVKPSSISETRTVRTYEADLPPPGAAEISSWVASRKVAPAVLRRRHSNEGFATVATQLEVGEAETKREAD
jgi:hypothetical protein